MLDIEAAAWKDWLGEKWNPEDPKDLQYAKDIVMTAEDLGYHIKIDPEFPDLGLQILDENDCPLVDHDSDVFSTYDEYYEALAKAETAAFNKILDALHSALNEESIYSA